MKIRPLGSLAQGAGQEAVAQALAAESGIVQGELFYQKCFDNSILFDKSPLLTSIFEYFVLFVAGPKTPAHRQRKRRKHLHVPGPAIVLDPGGLPNHAMSQKIENQRSGPDQEASAHHLKRDSR